MYAGKYVFAQVTEHLPMHVFRKCIARHGGNRYVKSFPCLSQFPCMAFAQLTHRESLRDIEIGLRAHSGKLHHMGIRGGGFAQHPGQRPTRGGTGGCTRNSPGN